MEVAKLLDRVPIPVKEGVDEPAAKINVLLQVSTRAAPVCVCGCGCGCVCGERAKERGLWVLFPSRAGRPLPAALPDCRCFAACPLLTDWPTLFYPIPHCPGVHQQAEAGGPGAEQRHGLRHAERRPPHALPLRGEM